MHKKDKIEQSNSQYSVGYKSISVSAKMIFFGDIALIVSISSKADSQYSQGYLQSYQIYWGI